MPCFIFVRHAESIGNVLSQTERAALDIPNHQFPLTQIGIQQAQLAGAWLYNNSMLKGRVLYLHSSFERARHTAQIIVKMCGVKPSMNEDARLAEKWDGIFHELSPEEVLERYPEQIRLRKRSDYYHFRPLGGVSCSDVELAIHCLHHELLHACNEELVDTILVVGHGRWFQLFQRVFHGRSVEEFLATYKTDNSPNGAITIYEAFPEITSPQVVVPWRGILSERTTHHA
jgi:broad specificity phosphatase PhoE